MESLFSRRVLDARRSVIRELLKLTEKPDIISFAGGIPDPDTFPREILAEISADEIQNNYRKSLQYTTTEGKRPLRQAIIDFLAEDAIHYEMDELIITSASQQGLDLVAKTFLDPGDVVLCSLPTYLGAAMAFRAFQARLVGVPLMDDGMDMDALERSVQGVRRSGGRPKLIYVVPDFQNPAGVCWSEEKRRRLLQIASREGLLVVEDMPYRSLRFSGEPKPAVTSLDTEDRVIVLFTFSKLLSAGLRLGAMAAKPEIVDKFVVMKQATDLCTPSLTQRLAARFMQEHSLSEHIQRICPRYREKRDAMLNALARHMPSEEEISWTEPEGGLFVWLRLPKCVDARKMVDRAVEHKVAYVPGEPFFVDGAGQNTLRLSFSLVTPEQIEEGISRLAKVVSEELASLRSPQQSR
ncbi:MAG: PLP-dependent aminotransferase family protein [Candidatus Bipolaricaulota bacterium]